MNDVSNLFQGHGFQCHGFREHGFQGEGQGHAAAHQGFSHQGGSPLGEGHIAGSALAHHQGKDFFSGLAKAGRSIEEHAFTIKGDGTSLHAGLHAGLKLPVLSANATEAEKHAALHTMINSWLGESSLSHEGHPSPNHPATLTKNSAPPAHNSLSTPSPHGSSQPVPGMSLSNFDFDFEGDEWGWGGGGWDDGGGWDSGWGGGWGGGGSHHGSGSGGESGRDDGDGYEQGKIDASKVAHGMPNSHLGGDTSKGNWTTNGPIGYIDDNWKYIETCEAVDMNYKLLGTAPTPDGLNQLVNGITDDECWNYQWGAKHRQGDDGKDMRGHLQTVVAKSSQAHDLIKQIYQDDTGTAPDEQTISSWQKKIRKSKAIIATVKDQVAHSQATADHLKETLTHMTGDSSLASDHFVQYYQNELAGDKDWDSVKNELLDCNELNGWLHEQTQFMTGKDATDAQMAHYHDELRAGKSSDDIKHDIAYSDSTKDEIDETLTAITGDPSLASDHFTQWYQNWMVEGASWNDVHNLMMNCNEVNGWVHGYVPSFGSGVTIGYGIDLSQFTKKELIKMNVSNILLGKIPDKLFAQGPGVIGLQGKEASMYIQEHPLSLTENEVDYMSSVVYNNIAEEISVHYDQSGSDIRFDDLPMESKSVIVDLAYRFGPNYYKSTIPEKQKIWQDFVFHDYNSAKKDILSYLGSNDNRAKNDVKELESIKQ